ncbi:3-hydroxyacyl-ACP dehydratase FabZ family protein [Bacillus cytotoxicus]
MKGTLPHRYPFLMIDNIVDIKEGQSVKGYKYITHNEWFISETQNSMPHMLIVEALAQLRAFVDTSDSNGLGFLSSLDGVQFHGKAFPDNTVILHYEVVRNRRGFMLGKGTATVDDQLIVTVKKLLIYKD